MSVLLETSTSLNNHYLLTKKKKSLIFVLFTESVYSPYLTVQINGWSYWKDSKTLKNKCQYKINLYSLDSVGWDRRGEDRKKILSE